MIVTGVGVSTNGPSGDSGTVVFFAYVERDFGVTVRAADALDGTAVFAAAAAGFGVAAEVATSDCPDGVPTGIIIAAATSPITTAEIDHATIARVKRNGSFMAVLLENPSVLVAS